MGVLAGSSGLPGKLCELEKGGRIEVDLGGADVGIFCHNICITIMTIKVIIFIIIIIS